MIRYLAALTINIPDYKSEILLDNFILRKRSDEELKEFYNVEKIKFDGFGGTSQITSKNDNSKPIHYLLHDSSGLGSEFYLEKIVDDNNWDFNITVSNFLRALRLSKSGKVDVPIIYSDDLTRSMNVRARIMKHKHLMTISVSELPEIIDLYKKIEKINNLKFNLINERFDNAITNLSTNKIGYVELVGIIESILLQNHKDELRFRFSLYLANILNSLNYTLTFKECQEIYDTRSKLVHTGEIKNFNDDNFFMLFDITQIIIKWYISNNLNDNKAQEELFKKLKIK